jgi:hypothetical protein
LRKLTLVVSCTDRKSLRPQQALHVGNLPRASVEERVGRWRGHLAAAPDRRPLRDLYRGEAWTETRRLERTAIERGFRTLVLVASAGLGLRHLDSSAPAYGATFALGHSDSVGSTRAETREWWASLTRGDGVSERVTGTDAVMVVLSDAYASALDSDLVALSRVSNNALLVGGHRDIDGLPRLPADRSLRSALGGTTTSLNVRTASAWLERLAEPSQLFTFDAMQNWHRWASGVRKEDTNGRTPLTDAQVAQFIAQQRRRDVTMSASRALRLLRDSGGACEQKRFSHLFHLQDDQP